MSTKSKKMTQEIKLAYYRKSDWDKLVNSAADRQTLHESWEDWNKDYERTKRRLKHEGFVVHDMIIDIEKLNRYCTDRGVLNNGRSRSQYASQLPLTQ